MRAVSRSAQPSDLLLLLLRVAALLLASAAFAAPQWVSRSHRVAQLIVADGSMRKDSVALLQGGRARVASNVLTRFVWTDTVDVTGAPSGLRAELSAALPIAVRAATALSAELPEVVLPGFFAHWNKNANFASDFDLWFLNLFPGERPFRFNAGGYTTLNFVPSLITMILGLLVGDRLRGAGDHRAKLVWMLKVGAASLVAGLLLGWFACPIVKRLWTPSWALYSGGIVIGVLALLFWLVELRGWRKWTAPFVIVGMNSIAIYLLDQLLPGWITGTLKTHFGQEIFSGTYGLIWQRCAVLLVLWLVCWWMYRRKIFLRI